MHPIRGATKGRAQFPGPKTISIHAPHPGCNSEKTLKSGKNEPEIRKFPLFIPLQQYFLQIMLHLIAFFTYFTFFLVRSHRKPYVRFGSAPLEN
jgi:hypothetical protein